MSTNTTSRPTVVVISKYEALGTYPVVLRGFTRETTKYRVDYGCQEQCHDLLTEAMEHFMECVHHANTSVGLVD